MTQMIHEPIRQYRPSHLALLLNSFPHLNVSLHHVNNTFAPESELYLESLGILGSIPAACLILTLFLLLVYLITRCCDRKPRPKHSIVVLKWTLAIFATLCCAAIGVNLYGNDDLHNGLVGFIISAKAVDEKINLVKNQTKLIDIALNVTIERVSGQLREVLDGPVQNQTALSELFTSFRSFSSRKDEALKNLRDITRSLKYVSLTHLINVVHAGETIRWPVTMVVMCLLLMFCIILLFGIAKHSRYALIIFSIVGLFAVILSWLLSSVYLTMSVAVGDFCVKPDAYIESKAPLTLQSDILVYYISCENSLSNPFTQTLIRGSVSIEEMNKHLTIISRISKTLFGDKVHLHLDMLTKEVYHTSGMMSGLAADLECNFFHSKYLEILKTVCHDGLFGLTFMLLSSLITGFFFTILVWLDSHAWIYIQKKQDYNSVDEQDPFLPPNSTSQAVASRTLRNQGREVMNGGNGPECVLRSAGIHSIGTISHQRLGIDPGQYATLNRKFRTLEHPVRGSRHMVSFDSSSHTLGHAHKKQNQHRAGDAGSGQYSTLSRKCKTLESNDFY